MFHVNLTAQNYVPKSYHFQLQCYIQYTEYSLFHSPFILLSIPFGFSWCPFLFVNVQIRICLWCPMPIPMFFCAHSYWSIVFIPIGLHIVLYPIDILCPFLLVYCVHSYWSIVSIPNGLLRPFQLVFCAHSYWAMVLIPIGR